MLIQQRYHSLSGCGAYVSNPLCDRQVVVSCTDAASSTRMLSAVFFDGRTFEYTRMRGPDEIMNDLIQRDDGMIGPAVGGTAGGRNMEREDDALQLARLY